MRWISLVMLVMSLQLPGQANGCTQFGRFQVSGSLPILRSPNALHETSGLEASRMNPGVLWGHDDANNSNEIVAFTRSGQLVQRYRVGSVVNGDWEDIAIGPGPDKGRDYIYLADFGNNNLQYSIFSLIRFPEPITPAAPGATQLITKFEVFAFRYPSQVHDAETLLIDPIDGVPYVLTKEKKSSGRGYLYSYPLPLSATTIKTLKLEAAFPHSNPKFSGGDVSQDGRWIAVRNDTLFYTYLRGDPSQSFASAFTNSFCLFDASNQGNAESLTLITDADGTRIYSTSEGIGASIFESVGKLPTGVVAIPSWWNFGSGVASGLWGHPGISLNTPPVVGRSVDVHLWSARPLATAAIAFGSSAIPDNVVRFGPGWAHVSPAIVFLAFTTSEGTAQLGIGRVPNATTLLGVALHAQGVVDDRAAPQSIALTRGLSFRVGR